MQNPLQSLRGLVLAWLRPSKAANTRRLRASGELMDAMKIREATAADVPAIAKLHVKTFNETHSPVFNDGPTYQVREFQWREMFKKNDGTWFCFVIENQQGELIGFAKGVRYTDAELPAFAGLLNKIYLLQKYHRQGLGRRLICKVAQRFLDEGVPSMLLFGEAQNPSNRFYEALGAERLTNENGEFHGGYGWRDLRKLVTNCS
jgi:L-amino acid N-acyltransferase YncA